MCGTTSPAAVKGSNPSSKEREEEEEEEGGKAIASINSTTSADRKEHGSEDPARNLSFLSLFCFSELGSVALLRV